MMVTIAELELLEERSKTLAYGAAIRAALSIHWAEYGTDTDATGRELTEKWCNECEMPAWPCPTREILEDVLNRLETK